jgi:hypothetical protein
MQIHWHELCYKVIEKLLYNKDTVLIMHQIFEYKIILFIVLGFIGCIILFWCFRRYIVPSWRERNNRIQIKPAEPNIMVNPMRIKQEKIMRII